jgi:diphthamide biosynthesis protein 3
MPLYEEIEIEDMTFDPKTQTYTYPCPCGDKFRISLEDLWDGEDIADCQSCTLFIQVIYEEENLPKLRTDSDDEEDDNDKTGKEKVDNNTNNETEDVEGDTVTDTMATLSIKA